MSKTLIRFDWAVKKLLRNKANFGILEGFLSELLFDDIRIERILESEGNQETEEDKYNRVDILTQNSKNELIIIEIQNTYEVDFFQRMAYGAAKALTENLRLGQLYSEIKKVISINIVYFDLGQGADYVYKGLTTFTGLHQNDKLALSDRQKAVFSKQNVSDIFPEYHIIKVNKFDDVAKDTLDEWVYFLKNSEVKDSFKAKGLKEAKEALDIMRLPPDDQYSYNRYLDYIRYKASEAYSLKMEVEEYAENKIKTGIETGLKEAEKKMIEEMERKVAGEVETKVAGKMEKRMAEERIELVKNAIAKGFDNKLISELISLSVEQVAEIRKNFNG